MSLSALGALAAPRPLVRDMPPPFDSFQALFENLKPLATAQVGLGLLLVLASLAFVRGHRWSRLALDSFTCAFAGWAVYFGAIWERAIWSTTVAPEDDGFLRVFGIAMMAGGALATGSFVLLAALAIRYLHGPGVQNHLSGQAARG